MNSLRRVGALAMLMLAGMAPALLGSGPALSGSSVLPEPPGMPRRAIAPGATLPSTAPSAVRVAGEDQLYALEDRGVRFQLFVPAAYRRPADGATPITLHFHGAPWFAIDEHKRYGIAVPLAVFALSEGSSVYQRPFTDVERLTRVIALVEKTLSERDAAPTRVTTLDLTSFSAGYGAIREILKTPAYLERVGRVVLGDSMYASWDPATTRPTAGGERPTSRPMAEQMSSWVAMARRAMEGKAVFVVTYSQVPTPYANSSACARALAEAVGLKLTPVSPDSSPAARVADYPLIERADAGHFHLWGYGGVDGQAHMTHARHIADVMLALRAAGK